MQFLWPRDPPPPEKVTFENLRRMSKLKDIDDSKLQYVVWLMEEQPRSGKVALVKLIANLLNLPNEYCYEFLLPANANRRLYGKGIKVDQHFAISAVYEDTYVEFRLVPLRQSTQKYQVEMAGTNIGIQEIDVNTTDAELLRVFNFNEDFIVNRYPANYNIDVDDIFIISPGGMQRRIVQLFAVP